MLPTPQQMMWNLEELVYMNKWILLLIPFLLGATYACGTGTSISKRWSCGRACSQNPNCVKIDASESIVNKKIEAGQLIALTQQEIDDIAQSKIDTQAQSVLDAIDRFDVTMEEIIIALVQRINTRIPSNPITKQEIIDQIKSNRGL